MADDFGFDAVDARDAPSLSAQVPAVDPSLPVDDAYFLPSAHGIRQESDVALVRTKLGQNAGAYYRQKAE